MDREIIKTLMLKAEKCADENMRKAIQKKIELLRGDKTVEK